jgi:tRNA pseudouridine38-40 synthase
MEEGLGMSMDLRNIKLTIAYDGTGFSGFQRQAKGERTVQGVLERALYRITRESDHLKLTAAGRTDAGVHAVGQVVNFFTKSRIPVEKWPAALNANLPADVVVRIAQEVEGDFHARYAAKKKTYQYRIYRSKEKNVFLRNYTYYYPYGLNLEEMRESAQYLLGEHSFKAFAASGHSVQTFVRHITKLDLEEDGAELRITIEANGFLYKMVRNIVGTLLLVGEGRLTPQGVEGILLGGDRKQAGPTAPPHGLFLLKVDY